MSEAELELLALAEYVQELEAALSRERSLPKATLPREAAQPSVAMGSPAAPHTAEDGASALAAPHQDSEDARRAGNGQVVERAGDAKPGVVDALAKQGVVTVERLPGNANQQISAKSRQQEVCQPSKIQAQKRVGLWGYITGADKVVTR